MAKGIKTGGRAKGTPNKASNKFREKLTAAANDYGLIDKLFADLDDLLPGERVRAISSILPYLIPKLSTVDMKSDSATVLPQIVVVRAPEDD